MFSLGALISSHPFEVARTMIINGETSHLTGQCFRTLQGLYMTEGIAGLYRGFIPRAIYQFPILMTANFALDLSAKGSGVDIAKMMPFGQKAD
jgi:hypothetical protein